jgi:hypothetical protein
MAVGRSSRRDQHFDPIPPGPSLAKAVPRTATLESKQSAELVSSAQTLNFDDFKPLSTREGFHRECIAGSKRRAVVDFGLRMADLSRRARP